MNLSLSQVERAKELSQEPIYKNVQFIQGDFMDISEEANSYDAAFLIEAMCHAPNKTRAFSDVYQILRPGSLFAGYD
ncbi:MAG: class I SAM-dependent methyltransferase [Bacteroidetes bacterium]|nr:class I SAM-dependent methyltransferase [Bacteroidota bacterium]